RLERGDNMLGHAVESTAVRCDRLQAGVPALARGLHLLGSVLAPRLETQDWTRGATGELTELVPARPLALGREAVVDEQDLRVRGAQEVGGVVGGIGGAPVLVHRPLLRLDAEVPREERDGAPVRDAGGDVRPLPRVRALGKEAAELVQRRRRRPVHAVRVVVDERNPAQYFSK